jgi:hypothetical protein
VDIYYGQGGLVGQRNKALVIEYTDNNKEIAASARKDLPKGTQ